MPLIASSPELRPRPAATGAHLPPAQVRRRIPAAQEPGAATFSAIVLADSHLPLAGHIDTLLRQAGAAEVRFATSPADLMRHVPKPGETGIGVICRSPRSHAVQQLIVQLRRSGWRRLVVAFDDADEAAIRLAIAGKVRCLIRRPVGTLPDADGPALRPPSLGRHELSPREVQVLQAVADGHTNNEIGQQLGLSGLTVKSHLARIARKAGTGDRAEMVAIAMRAGLLG